MGRLPDRWAGRQIVSRVPYSMEAIGNLTTVFAAGAASVLVRQTLNVAALTNNTDRPFEIHRVIAGAISTSQGGPFTATAAGTFAALEFIGLQVTDFTGIQPLVGAGNQPAEVVGLIRGPADVSWEWADPFYLPTSRGLHAETTIRTSPGATTVTVTPRFTFQGFLIGVGPATDRRG